MRTKRFMMLLLAVIFLVASLAGCGPATDPTEVKPETTQPDATQTETTRPDAVQPEKTEDSTVQADASIVRTTEDWPTYYDPAVGSDYSSSTVQANVYDPLVFPMADGSIRPHVATEWEVSDDALTYTFTIREDVYKRQGRGGTPLCPGCPTGKV